MNPDPQLAPQLGALVDCLEAEYRALLDQDCARLESVLALKERLLGELAAQAAPGRQPAVLPGRAELARLRKLNARNARTLAPRALANGARLRFLQAALGRAPQLYSADGSMASRARQTPGG